MYGEEGFFFIRGWSWWWYLFHAPLNVKVWHKAFFGGSGRKAVAHTRPAFPKNTYGPVGIPLIRDVSGAGRSTQPPSKGGKSLGEGPLRPKEIIQPPSYTRPDPCRRPHGRPKCYPAIECHFVIRSGWSWWWSVNCWVLSE